MLWPDFRLPPPARGGARLPEARPPLRRHQARSPGGRGAHVTRILSGLVLIPVVLGGDLVCPAGRVRWLVLGHHRSWRRASS
ncbi:MAG: hypothetical protein MZU84_04345 [Sphingobacterium sp.]|nr:hypothetical protein [Sphingobacterium sp.]